MLNISKLISTECFDNLFRYQPPNLFRWSSTVYVVCACVCVDAPMFNIFKSDKSQLEAVSGYNLHMFTLPFLK